MNKPYPLYDQRPLYREIRVLLAASARDYGESCAVSYREKPTDPEKKEISYRELERRVRFLGTELLARGLRHARCAVVGKLSLSWVLSYFALLSIGCVMVPLDPEWKEEDLESTMRKAGVSFLICDNARKDTLGAPFGRNAVWCTDPGNGESVEDLVKAGQRRVAAGDNAFDENRVDPETLALLVFTSGTTGKGKGVMLSQRNILFDIYGAQQLATLGKKTVGILPPHHTFGSTIGILAPVCIGCELYLSQGLSHFAKELRLEKPDCLILVPLFLDTFASRIRSTVEKQGKEALFYPMLRVGNGLRKLGIDPSKRLFAEVLQAFGGNLKQVICGGAPLSGETYRLFTSLGIRVLNGYGITECAPLISVNRPAYILPGSVGMHIPGLEVWIDGYGENGEGEICVKGPNVMLGYYEDPVATAEVIDPLGWFHTGDIGRVDQKTGYLYITGRSKNLIILSNGKNVYPEEIEEKLQAIPGVCEVLVYEGQSKRGVAYNRIVAEFFMEEEFARKHAVTDAEAYLRTHVEAYNRTAVSYKRIGAVRVRSEAFPKNTLRKIMRFRVDHSLE